MARLTKFEGTAGATLTLTITESLIIDGRDSHNGEGLVLPFQPGVLSIAASVQFWNFSVFGDIGLNDLDDTVGGIIVTNIFGNIVDINKYETWAKENNKFLIFIGFKI